MCKRAVCSALNCRYSMPFNLGRISESCSFTLCRSCWKGLQFCLEQSQCTVSRNMTINPLQSLTKPWRILLSIKDLQPCHTSNTYSGSTLEKTAFLVKIQFFECADVTVVSLSKIDYLNHHYYRSLDGFKNCLINVIFSHKTCTIKTLFYSVFTTWIMLFGQRKTSHETKIIW